MPFLKRRMLPVTTRRKGDASSESADITASSRERRKPKKGRRAMVGGEGIPSSVLA